MNRAYTIQEIDELRNAIKDHHTNYVGLRPRVEGQPYFSQVYSPSFNEVEEMLRTHMMAGKTAKDFPPARRP